MILILIMMTVITMISGRQAVQDAWLAEDYEADVNAFLAEPHGLRKQHV